MTRLSDETRDDTRIDQITPELFSSPHLRLIDFFCGDMIIVLAKK